MAVSIASGDILGAIGKTPLIPLRRLSKPNSGRVFVKYEAANPTGSHKDRMALHLIEAAERRGQLHPGIRILEQSGGSTGTALAMVCAVKGYRCHIVASDAFPDEKLRAMEAFGATLDLVPSKHGKSTYPELFVEMQKRIDVAREEPDTIYMNQSSNPDNPAASEIMAREILGQTDNQVDAWVMSVGSGSTFSGNARVFKAAVNAVRCVAVEPASYRHISGGPQGVHHIDGIGNGPPPSNFQRELVDEIVAVTDEEAYTTARTLAAQEGIFGGASSGANVAAALKIAEQMPEGSIIVTVICDTGYKYLQGELYRP